VLCSALVCWVLLQQHRMQSGAILSECTCTHTRSTCCTGQPSLTELCLVGMNQATCCASNCMLPVCTSLATGMSRVSAFRAGWHGCMVLWVALAVLLVLAAPSAAAVPRLKGQSGQAQVSEAVPTYAQQRLLQQNEAIHFQVVCRSCQHYSTHLQSFCRCCAHSSIHHAPG
jgi:hypothetical protein